MPYEPLKRHNFEPVSMEAVLGRVARGLGAVSPAVGKEVFAVWSQMVGPQIAANVSPVKLKGKKLVVSATDLTWATQLEYLKPDLLKRFEETLGAQAPTAIEIQVANAGRRSRHVPNSRPTN